MTRTTAEMGNASVADAMALLASDSGASDEYCRGMLVGLASGLLAAGNDFERTMRLMLGALPPNRPFRLNLFPESWQDIIRSL